MSDLIDPINMLKDLKRNLSALMIHGMSDTDFEDIHKLLSTAVAHDSESRTEFPDFVSPFGFIEHFHVTSGKSNKKGYDITIKESQMQKQHEEFVNHVNESLPNQNKNCLISQFHTSFQREDDSLENFRKSFISNWENHINHLKKYTGDKHISCFMISSDDVLTVHECIRNSTNGLILGDLAIRNKIHFCLAYDSALLDYMYKYKNDIDFVIYFNKDGYIEAIKLERIPFIKTYLSQKQIEIHALLVNESAFTYGVHIPNITTDTKV